MSQPDYPETVRCPECTHPYNPDSLTAKQREQMSMCPWCGPVDEKTMDEMTKELLTLLDRIEIETMDDHAKEIAGQRFEIAEKHGYTVVFGKSVSGEIQ